MRGLFRLLALLAGLVSGPASAAAEPAVPIGRWAAELGGGRVELSLAAAGGGFALRLVRDGRTLFDASFAPTDRPAVFEAVATGLFALLGSRRTPANPLEGEELVWARATPDGLVVSRLAIDTGKPTIERARLARRGDGVHLRLERLEGEAMTVDLEGELARSGR